MNKNLKTNLIVGLICFVVGGALVWSQRPVKVKEVTVEVVKKEEKKDIKIDEKKNVKIKRVIEPDGKVTEDIEYNAEKKTEDKTITKEESFKKTEKETVYSNDGLKIGIQANTRTQIEKFNFKESTLEAFLRYEKKCLGVGTCFLQGGLESPINSLNDPKIDFKGSVGISMPLPFFN